MIALALFIAKQRGQQYPGLDRHRLYRDRIRYVTMLDRLSGWRNLIEAGFDDGADGGITGRIDCQRPIERHVKTFRSVPAHE